MKQRGQYEASSPAFSFEHLVSRNGKYQSGQFAGRKVNRHLQMMVTSAISMVLCCTMFLGTTMAWFTDSVITAGNRITIGTLAVDLVHSTETTRRSLNPEIEDHAKYVFEPGIVWVPDRFEARKLTVINSGNLPIIYELSLLPSDHTVAEYFDVYITTKSTAKYGNLIAEERSEWEYLGPLSEVKCIHSGNLKEIGIDEDEVTQDIGVALRMRDNITEKEAQEYLFGKDFTLYISLFAYQNTADTEAVEVISEADQQTVLDAIAEEQAKKEAVKKEAEEAEAAAANAKKQAQSSSTNTETDTDNESQTSNNEQSQNNNSEQTQTGNGEQSQTDNGEQTQTDNGEQSQTGNGEQSQTGNGEQTQTDNGEQSQTGNGEQSQTSNGEQSQNNNNEQSQTSNGDESTASSQSLEEEVPDGSDSPDPESNIVADGDTTKTE